MKKTITILSIFLCISAAAQIPTYKWVSGSQLQREKSSLVLTSPGARNGASSFTDNDGNYYVFGGFGNDFSQTQGFFNDLWKYERSTSRWTWLDGQTSADKEVPDYNNSLSFDGVDDRVVLDSNPLEYDQSFTIELWFKTNSDGVLISSSPADIGSVSQGWSLNIEGDNVHVKKFYGDYIASFSTQNIRDNQWHHLAFTFAPGDDLFVSESISMFIDGEIIGNRNVDFRNELDPSDTHLTIIGSSQGNGNESYFNGQLDEIRFWNYTRNGAEIKSSRTIELSGKEAGLTAYYNFNEGTAGSSGNTESTLTDLVSNNNGTLSDNIYRPGVFIGEMANTRIWSNTLDDNGVKAASQMDVTGSETDLEMAFDFNIGTADGDNTSETVLPDLTGINDGFFNNFDLTGENSNLVEDVLKVSPQIYFSESSGRAVVTADLNNDTYDDIVTANFDPQSINVFINDQSGNLNTPVSLDVGSFARELTVGFWNDDLFPDIAVAAGGVTLGDEKVRIFFGDGAGGFSSTLDLPFPANSEPNEVRAADINGDTYDDLIVLLGGEDRIEIHYGDGSGTFPSSYTFDLIGEHFQKGLLIDDFTNDGYLDIATSIILNGNCPEIGFHANDQTGEFLTGTYFPISGCLLLTEILSEDFNNDGNRDIIYYYDNSIGSIIGNGDGTFREGEELYSEQTDYYINGFTLSDINSDGITDMVVISDNQILLFEGNGTGEFVESSQVNINFSSSDIISSDFDKNGSVDFIASGSDRVTVVKREADYFNRVTTSRTLNFDGVDDLINVPNLKVFDNSFTFESWIKTEDNGPLFSFTDQDQFAEWNAGQFSIVIKEGKLTFMVNGFPDIQTYDEYNLTNGEWRHVAIVVSINSEPGENDGVSFYIDGIENGSFYDYDFNEQIDNANGSFNAKLGYATGDFINHLGSTGISPESNWVDGVTFPESNSGRAYAAEWSDGENFYVFGGQGIDGIHNSLLRYSINPNECPDLTGVTYTFNSIDAYADFGAIGDQAGSGTIQSGSSNGSYVYTDISFGILQGGYSAGDGVGPELNGLCEDPFYSGNDQYGIAYTIISPISRSEDGSSITFNWSNDFGTGMGATTTITLDGGVWPEFETGSWPLISGSELPGDAGNYGLLNVSDPTNLPPARYALNATLDINNDVWIFGGAANEGQTEWFNDLWKYDPLTNQWLWKSGDPSVNGLAVYGSKGVSSSSNIPGPRSNHTIWSDDQGYVWVFGGYGLDSDGTVGHLNDLWKFDTQSLEWTWISGSNQVDEAGNYGTIDIYSEMNVPGGRSASLQWIDSNGIVWIFGGDGIDKFGISNSYLNDLWSYDPQSNQWAWHSGSDFSGSTGSYNETGLSSTEYVPGARWHSNGWVDENDDLWLFGGYKFNQLSTGLYNDFWKYEQTTKKWTWVSGFRSTAKVNELGVYGDENQGSKPHPGSRHGGLTWTDNNNDFWLLGGAEIGSSQYGFYNDLWKYSPQKDTWQYINGNTELSLNEGIYGSKGIGSDTNEPRSRWHGASWTGSDGKLWFFGGINHNEAIGNIAWINDLWNYDPESNTYTWMGGSKSINANGVYGEKGQSSINHIPGARSSSAYWSDKEGNFWLFGGYESFEYNNDLWKFDPSTLEWTWVSGNNFQNSPGIYGELRVANPANSIGARRYTDGRIDQDGNVWIFGGESQDSQAQRGLINDLWKYNPSTNMWTWMSGPKLINQVGNYGVKGVSSADNLPPGRYSHSMWIDDTGNVWVFGGYGRKDVDSSFGNYNDLWKFDVKTNEWTWMGGSDEVGSDGVFGVQAQFSESTIIPAKARALTFQTYDKSLWLFGGRNGSSFNDFWEIKFTPEVPFVQTPSTVAQNGFTFSYDEAWAREFRLQVSLFDDFDEVIYDEYFEEKETSILSLLAGTRYYYRVNAINEIGESGFAGFQEMLTLPATPEFESEELAISNLTSTSVNLNWIETPGILDEYFIDISRDASFNDESMIHDDYDEKAISVTQLQEVTGLIPGTNYNAKLKSSNASGVSPYSVTIPFLTIPAIPTFDSETIVTNMTQTSLTLTWNEVPEILLGYRLTISSLDDDFEDETAFLEDYSGRNVPKNRTFVNILNLNPGTQYYAYLTSVNDSGESDWSEKISILTTPASPVFSLDEAVEAIGQTEATVTWVAPNSSYEGYLLEVSTDFTFANTNLMLEGYGKGGNPKSISQAVAKDSIPSLSSGQTYFVRIRSFNSSGQSPNSNIISFTTVPKAPVFNDPSNVTQVSSSVSWSTPTGVQTYFLDLNTSENFDPATAVYENFPTAVPFEVISDLTPGTNYYVRVESSNSSGKSGDMDPADYGQTGFLTKPMTPSFISGGALTDVSQTSLTLNWNQVPEILDGYTIEVATSNNFLDGSYIDGWENSEISKEVTSVSVSDLEAGSNYYARLRSYNTTGSSQYSEVITMLTLPNIPTFVTDPFLNIGQSSATLVWNPVAEIFDGYHMELSTDASFIDESQLVDGYGANNIIKSIDKDEDTEFIDDLESGKTYYARLRSYNASGNSPFSDAVLLLTTPSKPIINEVTTIGQSNVDISWSAISGADNYIIDVSQNFFQTLEPSYNALSVDNTSIGVVGLSQGEEYQIRVRSSNASGESPNSEIVEIITAPATPVARDATNSSTSVFTANWDQAEGASYYLLEVSLDNFVTFHFNETLTTSNPIQMTGLQAGASYKYRLKAGNASGESPYSNEVTVVAQNNAQSLSISSVNFEENFAQSMSTSTVTVTLSGGLGDAVVNWRHKKVLSSQWSELIEASGSSTSYSFDVSDAMLDDVGVVFEVYATDNVTFVENLSNKIKRSFSESESSEIPILALSKWQMISIPYVLEDDLVTSVFNELGSQEYKKAWRLMHYESGTYQDAITGFTRIELGKGYWFNAVSKTAIKIGAGQANAEVPFKISLKEGWNQIGNPFNTPVDWTSVRNDNNAFSSVDDLITYNVDNNDFETSFTLSPFSGGFVWANEAVDELEIFPSSLSGRVERSSPQAMMEGENWLLPLQIEIGNRSKEIAGVGMNKEALAIKDPFDRLVPPRFEDYLEMYTSNHDYFYPYFATDVVEVQDEYVWNFELTSNHANGLASLNWDNTPFKAQFAGLWLVDERTGIIIEMAEQSNYSFNFTDKRSFSVHYSLDPNYEVLPSQLSLGDAFPNPAGESTKIPVLLPERDVAYDLELSVFDIQGKKITTIKKGSFEGGIYYFDWDFSSNAEIKSGIYLYQLSIDNQSIQSDYKKILIRK